MHSSLPRLLREGDSLSAHNEEASRKLLKKRRFNMDIWSIDYELADNPADSVCTIQLNMTFDLRTRETLKRAKIPLSVTEGVYINSYLPLDSSSIEVTGWMQESNYQLSPEAPTPLGPAKLGTISSGAKKPKGLYVVEAVHPGTLTSVTLKYDGSGAFEPPFPTNIHFLLRVKPLTPSRHDPPFPSFQLHLSADLKVEITREWIPNKLCKSAKWFRIKDRRGWFIPICGNFSRHHASAITGYGLKDAWERAKKGGIALIIGG